MLSMLLDALKTFWDWLMGIILSIGASVINFVMSAVPGLDSSSFENSKGSVAFAVSAANAWVPIDLVITLFVAYASFVAVFLTIKIAIKLIP